MKRFSHAFLLILLSLGILLLSFKTWWFNKPSKSEIVVLEANFRKVKKGMTKKQVKSLLGEEHNFFTFTSGKSRDEMNFWTYTPARSGTEFQVLFDERNMVEEISFSDEDGLCARERIIETAFCYLLY